MPRKILVVDDDIDVIESVKIPLEANGHTVVAVQDHRLAIETIEREKPDFVFLDVMFPGNSTAGFEICREIRDRREWRKMPVALISAINQQFNMNFTAGKETAGWVPADLFLEKPLDIEQMVEIVKRFDETGSVGGDA